MSQSVSHTAQQQKDAWESRRRTVKVVRGSVFLTLILLFNPLISGWLHLDPVFNRFGRPRLWETLIAFVAIDLVLQHFYYPKGPMTPWQIGRADILSGRSKSTSFPVRAIGLLGALALVVFAWVVRSPLDNRLLEWCVPIFLLFVIVEVRAILQPSESLLLEQPDELSRHFRARALQGGFAAFTVATICIYIVTLLAPRLCGLLIPVALTTCLLIPSAIYWRLDQQAERM